MDSIIKALSSELPFKVLVLLGLAYACWVITGAARVSEMHLARAACDSAQAEAIIASFGGKPAAERKRLDDLAAKACAPLKAASGS